MTKNLVRTFLYQDTENVLEHKKNGVEKTSERARIDIDEDIRILYVFRNN